MNAIRDYGQDQELIKQFLREFTYVNQQNEVVPKYQEDLTKIANRESVHLYVDVGDVEKFNQDIADQIMKNTTRYAKIFASALDDLIPSYKTKNLNVKDPLDVFIEQRLYVAEKNQRPATAPHSVQQSQTSGSARPNLIVNENQYPPELIRRAEVSFKPANFKPMPIRSVLAEQLGKLLTIRGIVTRATDVKPMIRIVTYTCDMCGCESFQPVTGKEYTPLAQCTSSICEANKTVGRINPQTRGSKFVKCQEIKLQELSDQVPTGHIPRTITVMTYGELTRQCSPGDHISVTGVFLTEEKQAYRARTHGLSCDTYIEAHYITRMTKTDDDELSVDPMEADEAHELARSETNFLAKLSSSIAPEIYGHEQLKKALLLLLVGGVDTSPHGMRIRGNINICLMGDPGVAKSQLLSFIDRLAIRSQYTTGRGSSGVGLTAAVLKDPITNEMVLEGGALVLADQGICCIDEFDKMMEADRTAIHEVMEQQTVSIAKAGIMTTLNARVSILAAANPAFGRYNVHRSITDNLQIPPALLSRFDLIWLIKDNPAEKKDLELAEHITRVHSNPNAPPPSDYDAIDMKVMRRYISLCKTYNPYVPKELTGRLEKIYLDIRARRRTGSREAMFTSPRSLLAIIRLSTAFARLRLSTEVEDSDITAAVDLYNSSRDSIEGAVASGLSFDADFLGMLQGMAKKLGKRDLAIDEITDEALMRGFAKDQIERALELLEEFDSIHRRDGHIILTS